MGTVCVSILGCGWLGLPLGRYLIGQGFPVKGSTTSAAKIRTLQDSGITPFLITCAPRLTGENIASFFQSNILFLNIPFRRDLKDPVYYQDQIASVAAQVERSPIKFVLFAGSTAVYPDSLKEAEEDFVFVPDNPRAKVLYETEHMLLHNRHFHATVIRFGGLYGGGRHLGQFMAGRKELPEAQRPVNLIHLEDCIGIAAQIIEKDIRGEIFNAVGDGHPARKELYTQAALSRGLEPPLFKDESPGSYKIVSNAKVKRRLDYTFRHPDPLKEL